MALEKKRKEIDAIDDKILGLLSERAKITKEISKEKSKAKKQVYVPEREREILERLLKENPGPLGSKSIDAIYRAIVSECRALEAPLNIAYLGPPTSFTHMAAVKNFGNSCSFLPMNSIAAVFSVVEKGSADYGVVPIENSTEGTVNHTLDVFMQSDLSIIAEVMLEIRHNLLSKHPLSEIKKVYSQPSALAQCRNWLANNLPKAELIESSSTAKAAELATVYHSSAAIASELAAKEYELNIVAKGIEDNAENVTRFLVIGKTKPQNPVGKTGFSQESLAESKKAVGEADFSPGFLAGAKKAVKNKTSIMFGVKQEPGTLFKALKSFSDHKINMTKIESRPAKKKIWEVVFFIDFEGCMENENVQRALKEMRENCLFVKILGSYPMEVGVSG